MTFKCELLQSEYSVLSGRIITKLSKVCFLCTYVDQMIIQQRFMFCSKLKFIIFLLMFVPLFSKFFINILKIYGLPMINKMIAKYCQKFVLTIAITRLILCNNFIWLLNYTPLLKMCPWGQRTLLTLN